VDVDQRRALLHGVAVLPIDLGRRDALLLDVLRGAEDRLGRSDRHPGVPATPLRTSITNPLSLEGYKQVRDAIAMGLTTGPIVTVFVAGAAMQNWRKKLRGGGETRPTGGYR